MKRVGIYVRVSTLEQAEEGYSISEQTAKLEKFCEIKEWKVYKTYTDPGFSGSNIKRPAIKELIRDVQHNKLDCVLVYKLDRLSRSQKDTLYLIEDVFNAHNVAFLSLNENFDTSTPFGKAMIGILSVFAQLEREQIKERMQLGKLGRAKAGKVMSWTNIAFGYKYVDGHYIVDQYQAKIIQDVYHDYLSGMGITKIADNLNNQGHPGKDIRWTSRAIRIILENNLYVGKVKYRGQVFDGDHEAIVDDELFNEVQKQLKERQIEAYEKSGGTRPFQAKYMVSGLLKCGECGASFELIQGHRRKDNTRVRHYKCFSRSSPKHNSTMWRNPNGCTSPNYEMKKLEQAVLSQIEKLKLNPKKIKAKSNKNEIEIYQLELDGLYKKMERLVELFVEGSMPKDILENKQSKLQNAIDSLENKIDDLNQKNDDSKKEEILKEITNLKQPVFDLSYQDQTLLVRKLVKKIVVYPDKLDITWNFE